MKNLNKENFWNRVYADYPMATQAFCDWIDAYKQETGWTAKAPNIKFHDLPIEMQVGILQRFFTEKTNACYFKGQESVETIASVADAHLCHLENTLANG